MQWILAAEGGLQVLRDISEHFSGGAKDFVYVFLVAAAGLGGGAFVLLYFFRPYLEKRSEVRKLWRALVEGHHLSGADESALRDLASRARVENPCEVFVRKSLFEREISRGRNTKRLTELRAKLF